MASVFVLERVPRAVSGHPTVSISILNERKGKEGKRKKGSGVYRRKRTMEARRPPIESA
jgi:hypothetical protein